jgi:RHS repeat-associated protein
VQLDATATRSGNCTCYLANGPSASPLNVNHIYFSMDVSTTSGLNGHYSIGNVFGCDPNGPTQTLTTLQPGATPCANPISQPVSDPGFYTFHTGAINNVSSCTFAQPDQDPESSITVYVRAKDYMNGPPDCSAAANSGDVRTGNTNFNGSDRPIAPTAIGSGPSLPSDTTDAADPSSATGVDRTYNSGGNGGGVDTGLFGQGWTSAYDESLTPQGSLMVGVTDPGGTVVYYARASTGTNVFGVVSPTNRHGQVTLNGDGTYTRALPNGSTHTFSAAGKLLSAQDRHGKQTTLTYDSNGRLVSATNAFGQTLTFNYPSGSTTTLVSSINDATGTIATYTYNGTRLASVTYPDGSAQNYGYSICNTVVLTSVTDALGNAILSNNVTNDCRVASSGAAGGMNNRSFNYVSTTETDVTDALGNVTKYTLSPLPSGAAQVTQVSGSCGCGTDTTWTYDASGNISSRADALGDTTTYTYDSSGDIASVTNPLGKTMSFGWDAFGNLVSLTTPLGGVYTNTTDATGNVLTTADPTGVGGTFTYDSAGNAITATDRLNHTTSIAYDAGDHLTSIQDPTGATSAWTYDSRGRVVTFVDSAQAQTKYAYDAAGRTQTITLPDSSTVANAYDKAGRLTSITDPVGHATSFAYDATYRLTKVTDAAAKSTQFGYDAMSNLTSLTDANGNATQFAYNANGQVTTITFPGGATQSDGYDAAQRMVSRVDRRGITSTLTYDAAGHLVGKSYSDGTPSLSLSYDANGNVVSAANGADTVSRTFDAAGRMLSEASTANGTTVSYTYDADGRRATVSLNGALLVTYSYDAAGRPTKLTEGTQAFVLGHDAAGRWTTLAFPNGVSTTTTYDTRSRMTGVTAAAGHTTIAGTTYTYDAASRVLSKAVHGGTTEQYTYDLVSRLTQVKQGTTVTESYGYDAVGNRLSSLSQPTWTYNAQDELLSNGTATLTYDANGNLVQRQAGANTWAYTWDAENRLVKVSKNGSVTATFAYDAFGRRISKTVGSTVTTFVYDADYVLKEVQGTSTKQYVYGPHVDEPLGYVDQTGTWSFMHTDGMGSVVAITNAKGSTTASRTYDTFGNTVSGTTANGPAFTGRYWDGETGLYYYRARYYDPTLGRFISQDPAGLSAGVNPYAYAGDAPTFASDPSGRFIWLPLVVGVVGAGAVLATNWMADKVAKMEEMAARGRAVNPLKKLPCPDEALAAAEGQIRRHNWAMANGGNTVGKEPQPTDTWWENLFVGEKSPLMTFVGRSTNIQTGSGPHDADQEYLERMYGNDDIHATESAWSAVGMALDAFFYGVNAGLAQADAFDRYFGYQGIFSPNRPCPCKSHQ